MRRIHCMVVSQLFSRLRRVIIALVQQSGVGAMPLDEGPSTLVKVALKVPRDSAILVSVVDPLDTQWHCSVWVPSTCRPEKKHTNTTKKHKTQQNTQVTVCPFRLSRNEDVPL